MGKKKAKKKVYKKPKPRKGYHLWICEDRFGDHELIACGKPVVSNDTWRSVRDGKTIVHTLCRDAAIAVGVDLDMGQASRLALRTETKDPNIRAVLDCNNWILLFEPQAPDMVFRMNMLVWNLYVPPSLQLTPQDRRVALIDISVAKVLPRDEDDD